MCAVTSLLLLSISEASTFNFFPAVQQVRVTQPVAPVSRACPFPLFIWCETDSATLPVLICSLGPGHPLFSSYTL